MKQGFFLILILFAYTGNLFSQVTANIEDNEKETKILLLDLESEEEVEAAFKRLQKYELLEEVILEGQSDAQTLQKIFTRLSKLNKLESVTFRNNGLKKFPENLRDCRNLRKLVIEENEGADLNDLFLKLTNSTLKEIHLIDNDIRDDLSNIQKLTSLEKINITGSSELDYEKFIGHLTKLPGLRELAIPVNFISELPENIINLKNLEILDVSGNSITELIDNGSSLKKFNNLKVHGNLIIDIVKELEKFKGADIRFLTLDKEVPEADIEQIRMIFPKVEINFANETSLPEPETNAEKIISEPVVKKGELRVKKEFKILSPAYLLFPLVYRDYNFDTLGFNARYLDLRYANTYRIFSNRIQGPGSFSLTRMRGRGVNKGTSKDIWFHLPNSYGSNNIDYTELNAFRNMYWVYKGNLSKKQFKKQYIGKRLLDIRLSLDRNNSLFNIQLKTETGFENLQAYPVLSRNYALEKTKESYSVRFASYQRALSRRMVKFHSKHIKDRIRYDLNLKRIQDQSWVELQTVMSDKEKLMSREEWLEYYDSILDDELRAIDNAPVFPNYLLRALALRSYILSNQPFNQGARLTAANAQNMSMVTASFVLEPENRRLANITSAIVIDKNRKSFFQVNSNAGEFINFTLSQNSEVSIILLLRNGDFGLVTSEEMEKQIIIPGLTNQLKVRLFDKNLNTIGELLKAADIK